jgi:hypothetical protein
LYDDILLDDEKKDKVFKFSITEGAIEIEAKTKDDAIDKIATYFDHLMLNGVIKAITFKAEEEDEYNEGWYELEDDQSWEKWKTWVKKILSDGRIESKSAFDDEIDFNSLLEMIDKI